MSELPDGWTREPGEANRPLSEKGGYYHSVATHYSGEYLVTADTTGTSNGVDEHVVHLEQTERKKDGDLTDPETLEHKTFEAEDKEDEDSQEEAEKQAEEYAIALMRRVNDDEY